jgi:hypothetical protein
VIERNEAFLISDPKTRSSFEAAYRATSALYYREQPTLTVILERLSADLQRL